VANDNQHYVPKFLIKKFSDTDGRVFCLNIQTNEITKPPPKQAASDIDFYEFAAGFDDILKEIETASAPVFKKIVTECSLSSLSSTDREKAAYFVAVQSFRTNAFLKGLSNIDSAEFGSNLDMLLRSAFVVASTIKERKWLLMKIERDGAFYLGDHPVVLQKTENPSGAQSLGFDIIGVEAFLPITPKLALCMPCESTSDEIISSLENAKKTIDAIKQAKARGRYLLGQNVHELNIIQHLIERNAGFYNAITKGSPLICSQENIENLNYLQVMFAHESIFSNQTGFTFARHVLDKTPQYRETLATNVLNIGSVLVPADEDQQ